MTAPRILLVCYYFPPLGGAGVGRPLALARHLATCGIECHVLTVKNVAYRVFEPELLQGIEAFRIHRTGSWDPQRLLYLFGRRQVGDHLADRGATLSARFFPDSKVGWAQPAARAGMKLMRKQRFDLVLSTSPPVSAHLVGHKLAVEFGVPWVADFRDFWTSYRIEDTYSDAASVDKARTLLRAIRARAAAITTCNAAIADYVGGGEVIYNSFDSALAREWPPPVAGGSFNIGLLGTYDPLVPVAPLLTVERMIAEHCPETHSQLRFVSVGRLDESWLRGQLLDPGSFERWCLHGFRSRRESIRLLSDVHLFYVGLAAGVGRGIVPGRLFDMLASGRHVLAADETGGEIARLVDQARCGIHFDPADADAVHRAAKYVSDLARKWQSGELHIAPRPACAETYADVRMVERFAAVMRRCLGA